MVQTNVRFEGYVNVILVFKKSMVYKNVSTIPSGFSEGEMFVLMIKKCIFIFWKTKIAVQKAEPESDL